MIILHWIEVLGHGGKERRMIQLVRALSVIPGYKQYIIVNNPQVDYEEIYEAKNVEIIHVPIRGRLTLYYDMCKAIKKINPDIVHSWVYADFLLPLYVRLCSKAKYIAGYIANGDKISRKTLLRSLPSYWLANSIISNSLAGLIAKRAIFDKSRVIYNGFDFARFPKSFERNNKRKELGVSDTAYVVIMVARFDLHKDWFAFAKMVQETTEDNIFYLAVGDGDTRESIEEQTANCINVKYLGRRKDVEELLLMSDASVLFTVNETHAEGISNSIMEAMAAGLPVIATDGGGTPEIIEHEKNGFIIQPHDYKACIEIIKTMRSNTQLQDNISNNAKKTIMEKFSIKKMVAEYIQVYNSLIFK